MLLVKNPLWMYQFTQFLNPETWHLSHTPIEEDKNIFKKIPTKTELNRLVNTI